MSRPLYRFADCSVDPAARELRRGDALVGLSPKVFDCLAYLIEHRDRAVGRDELIAAVWGRADVSDALLGQTVLKARRAIGDSGDDQNAIRTIPRFGYRWVATIDVEERATPTSTITETEPAATEAGDVASSDAPHRRPSWRTFALALLAFMAGALAFSSLRHRSDAPTATDTAPHAAIDVIAVMPAQVEAGDEWSWLRLGLMDLVATRLQKAGIAVVPSDNVVALARSTTAPDAAAQAIRTTTGAQRLLLPKVTLSNNEWRVHLELRSNDGVLEADARNAEAVLATRAAVEQLLQRLGKPFLPDSSAESASLEEVQQRVEAAILTSDVDAARHLIESAAPALRDAPQLRLRMAQADLRGGQIAAARQQLDALLADLKPEADPVLRARALTIASSVAIHQGDTDAAKRACDEAIALLETRNEPAAIGRAYTACGIADASAGHFDVAMNRFAQARVAFEITGDALSLARIEANEGNMENTRGRYAEGAAIMRRSEERFRRFGGRIEVLQAITDQIDAHLALLQPIDALATSERGWAMLPQIENGDMRRILQIQHARALAANGRVGEASSLLAAIVGEAVAGQEPAALGQARATQARIELATGREPVAIEHARVALDALAKPDDARERALAWLTLVRALLAQARDADAASEAARLVAWSAGSSIASVPIYAALANAEVLQAARKGEASSMYARALDAAERAGVPLDTSAVAISWGGALIEAGDLEHASAVIGRVARWADSDFECSVAQARLYRALHRDEAWTAALQRARALAGERAIPAAATAQAVLAPPSSPAR